MDASQLRCLDQSRQCSTRCRGQSEGRSGPAAPKQLRVSFWGTSGFVDIDLVKPARTVDDRETFASKNPSAWRVERRAQQQLQEEPPDTTGGSSVFPIHPARQ